MLSCHLFGTAWQSEEEAAPYTTHSEWGGQEVEQIGMVC